MHSMHVTYHDGQQPEAQLVQQPSGSTVVDDGKVACIPCNRQVLQSGGGVLPFPLANSTYHGCQAVAT